MAKSKKEKCSVCHDRGYIEFAHGLFNKPCTERCAAFEKLRDQIREEHTPPERTVPVATGGTEEAGGSNEDSQGEGSPDTGQSTEREEPEAEEEDGDTSQ